MHSYLTGVAVIGHAIQEATMADTLRAEMIALPVLILVLLLVFRSPVAAAVPLAMGGATVMAGHGLLWLASFLTPINSLGVAIAAMMSLALGVDYALLMVSRVRQELAGGWDYEDGRGDRVQGGRAHDRRGRRHAGADDARGERGGDAGAARPGGDRRRHLGPAERRPGAERDAGTAAPARPARSTAGRSGSPAPAARGGAAAWARWPNG